MKITIQKCFNYTNPSDCGIAKGLRKKGIIAVVSATNYHGYFLGVIPVWGKIPKETNDIAHNSDKPDFIPTKVEIGLYD